jgi:UDP:flavonoid glycosyltransferase YjiC (YdhE family)
VRIAFSTNPALGHVLPLLPLAMAARDAGHDVVVLAGASCEAAIAGAGLRHVRTPTPDLPSLFARLPGRAGLTGARLVVATWRDAFAGVLAEELAAAVLELARDWKPDLVIHEDSEQGSWIAAERLRVPHVTVQATAWRGAVQRLSREPLGRLRAAHGLPPDPELARWHAWRFLTTRPPAFHDPADPMPASTRPLRPQPADEVVGTVPPWVAIAGRRRVCVTMGTMPMATAAVLPWITKAFDGLDVEVIVTLGPVADAAELGTPPTNVRLTPYVPMSRLLPTCDAVVFHAGSGTLLAALSAGVPMVVLPVGADQPANAAQAEAAGVGIALEPPDQNTDGVRTALERVLGDRAYREAAARVREQIEAMPGPAAVMRDLELLVEGA